MQVELRLPGVAENDGNGGNRGRGKFEAFVAFKLIFVRES